MRTDPRDSTRPTTTPGSSNGSSASDLRTPTTRVNGGRASTGPSRFDGMLAGVYYDLGNRCDLCDKPLLVTDPVRSRCDQCVRYGAPTAVAPKIRVIGGKAGTTDVPCAGCGQKVHPDDGAPIVLVGDHCVGCLLKGAPAVTAGSSHRRGSVPGR